jgi:hypothetical protein
MAHRLNEPYFQIIQFHFILNIQQDCSYLTCYKLVYDIGIIFILAHIPFTLRTLVGKILSARPEKKN